MTEGISLDDLLNSSTEAEPAPEPVSEPAERPRDENGRFAAKTGVEPTAEPETEQQAEPVPPTDKLPQSEYKAIKEEREKRQAVEREIEALKAQIQSLQKPAEPPAPPPSLWEDEQGWQQHLQRQVLEQANQLSRINASEMAARAQHADFPEMFDLFNQMAATNPSLAQQAMADPHPWGKAYQIAKSYKATQELGAVDVADLEAKIREKVLAEMQEQMPVQRGLPPTLTGERSVASRSGPAWAGPTPLGDLLR